MDKTESPSLLPIFRSQQQAELLALLLGNPTTEFTLAELGQRTGIPYASLHREVNRAISAGLLVTMAVGRTRLVRADTSSPYYTGLADVLVRAFGPPWVLAEALATVDGVSSAYLYGSWAARFMGEHGDRPVADIDLLVLGEPDRSAVFEAVSNAERRLGRPVQVTVRPIDWLESGSGTFHATVTARPLLQLAAPEGTVSRKGQGGRRATAARPTQRQPEPAKVPIRHRGD